MGIETALFGASLMSATAGASTVGLLGAGGVASLGAGSLFGGSLLSTIGTGLSIASAASSIFGGAQSYDASKTQAAYAMFDAENRGKEIARQTAREANAEQQETDQTLRRQKLAYLASGVTLQGSPLLIMEETRRKGQENIDEIMASGSSGASAAIMEGRQQASNTKASGRRDLVNGLTGAASTLGKLV